MSQLFRSFQEWDPGAAREQILQGRGRTGMRVRGRLDLSRQLQVLKLPIGLTADEIDLADCPQLRRLPHALTCQRLTLRRSGIECLAADLHVKSALDARECRRLECVAGLSVVRLDLTGCVGLVALDERLDVVDLILDGCYQLAELPATIPRRLKNLNLRNCASLVQLPSGLLLDSLDIRGCRRIESLPADIHIKSSIDVAGSGLSALPCSLRSTRVRWNGVQVSDRIAFDPQSITIEEILTEPNAALRRVLLERVGVDWFVDHAEAQVVDTDHDAAGTRRLLRILFDGDEDYLFVEVHCPSTRQRYILRVPPTMRTCQEAVAWTAGYTNPDAYQPAVET